MVCITTGELQDCIHRDMTREGTTEDLDKAAVTLQALDQDRLDNGTEQGTQVRNTEEGLPRTREDTNLKEVQYLNK